MKHSIVPPYLLAKIAQADEHGMAVAAAAARRALEGTEPLHEERRLHATEVQQSIASTLRSTAQSTAQSTVRSSAHPAIPPVVHHVVPPVVHRTIFDAQGAEKLPGKIVRREGQSATADVTVTEAYDGLGATFDLFSQVFGRDSIDGKGLPLLATVHYGRGYDNAYWDGERMVFGDGDGEVFGRFTASVSVIGHELAHGVTQFSSGLAYEGQSGALNESFSDVMGVLVEQHQKNQTAAEASWLVGEGLFTPAVQGTALRSMTAPGTAYDDDVLGKDPQPADMAHYVKTTDDNGGVHLNSGIPNRAFSLAALELGGFAWERAGQIWYDTMTAASAPTLLPAAADFATFARATVGAATLRYGAASPEADAVGAAWVKVGVLKSGSHT
ncbi:M4 family metallopeptidase [Subtercola frigoramans]|uniref:Neutral metalloproteinase n=1 Tax=Subtercola frigoramans TaxID=120298 RepID=A0ABS2L3A1_9MICO|nr:M4 family metallopeptidase [Subtercola frigoramans]MBM7471557.1 Zn-dependent metalloprotease [Subtercola frigoramans]